MASLLWVLVGVLLAIGIVLAMAVWHALDEKRSRALILTLLDTGRPRCTIKCTGMDLVRRSRGKLSRGTVYMWLDRMEADGLIESEPWWLDGSESDLPSLRRRIYRLKASP